MGFSGESMPFLHGTAIFTKIPFLRVFLHYDHYETFTSLFYFWKTNILKKSLEFYLDFENLSFLTNFGFSRGAYMGVPGVKIQKNFIIPNFYTLGHKLSCISHCYLQKSQITHPPNTMGHHIVQETARGRTFSEYYSFFC